VRADPPGAREVHGADRDVIRAGRLPHSEAGGRRQRAEIPHRINSHPWKKLFTREDPTLAYASDAEAQNPTEPRLSAENEILR